MWVANPSIHPGYTPGTQPTDRQALDALRHDGRRAEGYEIKVAKEARCAAGPVWMVGAEEHRQGQRSCATHTQGDVKRLSGHVKFFLHAKVAQGSKSSGIYAHPTSSNIFGPKYVSCLYAAAG